MNKEIQEAIMYLEHTTKDDFNLENHQAENRIWAIKTLIQELQRKDNIIIGIKKEINEQLEEYEKGKEIYKKYGSLEDYTRGLRSAYINILDNIKELEERK